MGIEVCSTRGYKLEGLVCRDVSFYTRCYSNYEAGDRSVSAKGRESVIFLGEEKKGSHKLGL